MTYIWLYSKEHWQIHQSYLILQYSKEYLQTISNRKIKAFLPHTTPELNARYP